MALIFNVFLVCCLLQLIWLLGFFSRLAWYTPENHQPPAHPSDEEIPEIEGVSVIICAHNELQRLKQLVPALITQEYPLYEVIIVNDRSDDGTHSWLESQALDSPNLKLLTVTDVPQGINPKKNALLTGIEAASHNLLLLTDADCYPKSNQWIDHMAGAYHEKTKIVLGYSGYEKTSGLLNMLIRYETLLTAIQYFSRALDHKPYMGVGRNLSYRKSFFNQVGGLKDVMQVTGGDDDLFVNKHATGENTNICLNSGSFTVSKPKSSWKAYFTQKKRHLSVGKYYKQSDKWILGIFSATHIIFWSSLVSLLIASTLVYWVAAGFFIRQLVLSWVIEKSSRKLDQSFSIFLVPLLDFLYSIFYLYTGLSALVSKKVKWH